MGKMTRNLNKKVVDAHTGHILLFLAITELAQVQLVGNEATKFFKSDGYRCLLSLMPEKIQERYKND